MIVRCIIRSLFFFVLLAAGSLSRSAVASTVVFQDGKVEKDVEVVSETDAYVEIALKGGKIRFPRAAIKTIDGKPAVFAPPAPESASPSPTGEAPAVPPVTTPEPAVSEDLFDPAPAASSSPTAAPDSAESADVIPEPAAPEAVPLPNPAAASVLAPEMPSAPDYLHQWNFEWVLLVLLISGGVWARSVQWVQKDLFERRKDPRVWTLVALFLPALGAAAYAVTVRVGDLNLRRKTAVRSQDAQPPSPPDGGGGKLPWMEKMPDPAAHLAAKGKTRRGFEFLDTERKSVLSHSNGDAHSGLDHAGEMLEEALLESASDVHIEPTANDYRVRFRLDGILHERMTYDTDTGRRVVTSLKSQAEIDVAEKRKAQDGHFRVRSGEREVDFRVATANSIHGEKMVIRILDHQSGVFDLTSLGMSDDMLTTFQSVIQSRSGMILATGPTGAGKTSTLYAALRQLDAARLNIMTIEDPPEYELARATQLAVNPKAGITYESGLRSILRQDPDVILVGEMRDTEAGQVALRAALTGHLVLSSLHTKDAVGTVTRLQDMGIERYQVASGLLMVIAQRLVRVLCPHCRQPYECQGDELEGIGFSFEPGAQLFAAVGCDHCLGTGFKGRTGLFELLVMDEEIRRAIGEGADETAIEALVVERGFRSYRYDGAEKVLLGITTAEEVLQSL